MDENKNIRKQTIARTGASGSAKLINADLTKIIDANVSKSIDENISKIDFDEILKTIETEAETTDAAVVLAEAATENKDPEITAEETAEQDTATEETEEEEIIPVAVSNKNNGDNKKDKSGVLFIVLLVLTIVILISSCAFLFFSKSNTDSATPGDDTPQENIQSASLDSPFNYQRLYGVDFPANIQDKYKIAYAQNQDLTGWLTIPGTSIDMPVYQCDNNSYYLKHDNYDTYTKYGTLFMDMENDPLNLTRNTTIYGHNFDNKLIFDELHNYKNLEFFKDYPVIEFNTIYKDYKWKVIAAFHTNGEAAGDNNYLFYYIASNFGDNSFMKFYDELQQRSYIHTGVDVQPSDKILTLSTCTYFFDRNGALENARFVVVARLVRDGESEEVDVSKATENTNVRYPQLYFDVFGGTNPWKNASKWVPEGN